MYKTGQSLGDYVVLMELGRGGYGHVYKVEHTITGRREAMKVLVTGDGNATEQADRFLREIRLQASLSHPNIAVVHTAFWVNDDLALVCELLEGQSLQQLLEQQQPPQEQALDIVAQVLAALSYAHARGIIHRDISPANIFLTAGELVKIIDFGLAKAATDLRLTREGSPIGAAHYMSPEQVRGAQDIDARTDIYSCGVVLFELLTGKKPFEGDNAFTIMKAHTEEPVRSPAAVNSQVPAALAEIVLRALAKKPEERFQSADAFLQAIKHVAAELAKASANKSEARPALKRPVLVAAVAALTILIGILVAAVRTTRLASAPIPPAKSFSVPAPPAAVSASPVPAVVVAPPTTSKPGPKAGPTRAAATKPAKRKEAVRNLVKEAAPETPAVNAGPVGLPAAPIEGPSKAEVPSETEVPSEAKPRNPVVKLGGVLKRINPFQGANKKDGNDGKQK